MNLDTTTPHSDGQGLTHIKTVSNSKFMMLVSGHSSCYFSSVLWGGETKEIHNQHINRLFQNSNMALAHSSSNKTKAVHKEFAAAKVLWKIPISSAVNRPKIGLSI